MGESGAILIFNGMSISQLTIIPEPSTALLLGLGLVGLTVRRKRTANASRMVTERSSGTRPLFALLIGMTVVACASTSQAAFLVNFGATSGGGALASAGQGPSGADAGYVLFGGTHETAALGTLATFAGQSFAEGGEAGAFSVGLEVDWSGHRSECCQAGVWQGGQGVVQ